MNLKRNIAFGALILSCIAYGDTTANTTSSSTTLSDLVEQSKTIGPGYFYLVDDFSQLKAVPGFSFGAPAGLSSSYGGAFLGVSGTHNSDDTDGGMAVGAGFGNASAELGDRTQYLGLGGAMSLSIGSIDPSDDGAGDRGSLNLSLGHNFTQHALGFSVGVSGIDLWHADSEDEIDESYYFAFTKLFANDVAPFIISLGMGNKSYADIGDDNPLTVRQEGEHSWNEFASAAVYVHPQMSIVLDYTTGLTTIGASIVPMPDYPISIGLAAQDIFKEDEGRDDVNFLGTLAIGFSFESFDDIGN